ncbi:hypothetical protein J7E81_29890 [Bacillus sp. ISL-18]|uniref:hypothetical protein n=1 Tax=Bacillus sp. ISL-18 TaxID=2819118 RepID=UPI001BEB2A57|nr:hypothetical protein [Bacillus sp. ISL-18]MBT2659340.1 hypothetical protein [Bacillus sp. ISL-18]
MDASLVSEILLILIVLIGLIITLKYIRPMIPLPGVTVYKSTGLKVDYPLVDLEKKEVTGIVSFKNKKCMSVIVNFQSDTVKVKGSIENIRKEQYDSDYINMIKDHAKFFVENKISNPKKYYEQLI